MTKKEALDIVKSNYPECSEMLVKALEILIPELKDKYTLTPDECMKSYTQSSDEYKHGKFGLNPETD